MFKGKGEIVIQAFVQMIVWRNGSGNGDGGSERKAGHS